MSGKFWRWLTRKGKGADSSGQEALLPQYLPLAKHYVFNETGNILLCATADSIQHFNEDIRNSFIDVSVFFTAMTKAVHSTINPVTQKPFSIYNYQVIKNVLNQSGMFVETNVEEGEFCSQGVGAPLGKELIQTILNRNFSEFQLHFSKGMFNGMGHQKVSSEQWQKMSKEERRFCRSGNIFFICELLLGVPQTSAIVVKIDPYTVSKGPEEDRQNIFDLGNVNGEDEHEYQSASRHWTYKKRTYLFVPPSFFKSNIARLKTSDSQEFDSYVEFLAERLRAAAKNPATPRAD
ncbi:hypothetical protein [Desulfobacter vibrioformis]|uniref:hypothetical protein n=1 Tax=Desulfobacter vibrioformis TaxID=34031 RepID=UPI0012EBAD84|nr:hypothetical protein [Desulfobacter vibrioformis]